MNEDDGFFCSLPKRTLLAAMFLILGKMCGIMAMIVMWVQRPVAGILLLLAGVGIATSIFLSIKEMYSK